MRQRPLGVTILALLVFLNVAITACIIIVAATNMAILDRIVATLIPSGAPAAFTHPGTGATLVLLVSASLALLLGIGLWRLRNWARVLLLILAGLSVLGNLAFLLVFRPLAPFLTTIAIVRAAIAVLIVWYLLRPPVREAFRPS